MRDVVSRRERARLRRAWWSRASVSWRHPRTVRAECIRVDQVARGVADDQRSIHRAELFAFAFPCSVMFLRLVMGLSPG